MSFDLYLNIGAGNPWAGQSNAKLFAVSRTKENVFESEEKVGAFDPTGSVLTTYKKRIRNNNF